MAVEKVTAQKEDDYATAKYVEHELTALINLFTLLERVAVAVLLFVGGYAHIRTLMYMFAAYFLTRRAFAFLGKVTWTDGSPLPRPLYRFLEHRLEGWTPLPMDMLFCYYMGYAEVARTRVTTILKTLEEETAPLDRVQEPVPS